MQNQVKNKEGKILTDEDEIMERWKQYFQGLLNTETIQGSVINETSDKTPENKNEEDTITNEQLIRAF